MPLIHPVPQDRGEKRRNRPAIWKGMRRRCPCCEAKTLFRGYSKITPTCGSCGLDFSGHRADDAPPYLTMMIVGHTLAFPMIELKRVIDPPLLFQLILWLSLATAMTLFLLPVTKGGMIGLQWAQRMHGFGNGEDDLPDPTP